ncbi:MAG: hypothetical protein GC164_08330 [Phycisphaera sp.]|nr:hypothetical protein [Phycisphaera sp.]
MNRDRVIQLCAIALTLVFITAAGFVSGLPHKGPTSGVDPLNPDAKPTRTGPATLQTLRDELQLDASPELGGQPSPMMVMLAAGTGAFRGLVIDVMWYRIEELKQKGKFFETNQLAQFITDLQPRFAEVWRYHAWNMAYNISVQTQTPQERWYWVRQGIEILRDKGIPYNPRSVNLYRELSWIFFHKIGQYSDDMHWYYKRMMAREWQEVLGTPTIGVSTGVAVERFRKVAQAPDSVRELIEQSGSAGRLVAALGDAGFEIDETLLRQVGRVFMYNNLSGDTLTGATVNPIEAQYPKKLTDILTRTGVGEGLPDLLNYLRKKVIVEHYHMRPDYMLHLMELYGPLDWRHPASHGAYWSELGVDISEGVRSRQNLDLINTARNGIQSFQELTYTGYLTYSPYPEQVGGYLNMAPDPRFIKAYDKAMDEARETYKKNPTAGVSTGVYDSGHENFLLWAMQQSYLYGDVEEAENLYAKARRLYGNKPSNVLSGRYTQPIYDLVMKDLGENFDNRDVTLQFIDSFLLRSFVQGLATNRMDLFTYSIKLAKQAYDRYEGGSSVNPNAVEQRKSLGKFDQIVSSTFARFLTEPYSEPIERVRAWANAPNEMKLEVYDRVRSKLEPEMKQAGFDFDRAFPAPDGLEAYRNQQKSGSPR